MAPPSLLYDRMSFLRKVENEAFLDFQFYNIPRQLNTYSMYRFPSQLIGYEGVFNAYRYLSKFSTGELTADKFDSEDFSTKYAAPQTQGSPTDAGSQEGFPRQEQHPRGELCDSAFSRRHPC